jgi:hypothetical protein
MDNYLKVKKIVEDAECSLLTTFEDFEEKRKSVLHTMYLYVRIDFIGICGHNSSAVFTNFKSRKTGIRCKECVAKTTREIMKNKMKDAGSIVKTDSLKFFEKYLSPYYEIQRTKEGCKADLIIKPKDSKEDVWIPLQAKATQQVCHKMYSFKGLDRDYTGMLIICGCITDDKIWIIPYSDVTSRSKINISVRSKYNKYLVEDKTQINEVITKYECIKDCCNIFMTPVCEYQQREQEYVKKRELYIDFLNYVYPELHNTTTDFMVSGKKVQEKVMGYESKHNRLTCSLASNNLKDDRGKRKWRTYYLGENNYYWLHSSHDDRFWIIPEMKLHKRGKISDSDKVYNKKVLMFNIEKVPKWIKKWEFNYKEITDTQKLLKCLDKSNIKLKYFRIF